MAEKKNEVIKLEYAPGRPIDIIGTNSITMVEIKTYDGTIINVRLGMNEVIEIIPSKHSPQVTLRDPPDLNREIRAVEPDDDQPER
ncbi:hypothetical protein ACUXK4_004888 [Methylorubrum extorquens]